MPTGKYYHFRDAYVAYAVGDDLTAWRNGDAALVVGELHPIDNPMIDIKGINNMHEYEEYDTWGTGDFMGKETVHTITKPADFALKFKAKTGVPFFWGFQVCSTATGTPEVHTMSKAVSQTPISLAFHVEFESSTTPKRWDLLGCWIEEVSLECLDNGDAEWTITGKASKVVAGGDLAKPTNRTSQVFRWRDYKNGGFTFTYNSNAVDASIRRAKVTIKNQWELGEVDSGGYYDQPTFLKQEYMVGMTVVPFDTNGANQNLLAINETVFASYAGDLLIKVYAKRATNDDMYFQLDKARLLPFSVDMATGQQASYEITLVNADGCTASGVVQDALIEENYENTA